MVRYELTDEQKRSLALKMLTRAEDTLADAQDGRRDTALGEFIKDMAKYHNEILSDGSRCLSENEIRDAAVRACKLNRLTEDSANGGLAKVEADVPRCLAANRGLRVDDWTERFDKTANGTAETSGYVTGYEPIDAAPTLAFADIEDGFWAARQSLQDIYIGALSKMCAPWAVLAFCAARALAQVRPHIVLPDVIGGPGSLNWYAAITATSGGGKGAASAVARQLVTDPVQQRNAGSGEGMISAYRRPATEDEPAGLYESIMFVVDEIDSLTAQSKRSGTTTMPVLRSAFSGETLGFSYVNKNTPIIEAHSYRMTMVVSVQPQRAGDLLADHHGGTPQRFMWFPGNDQRVSQDLAGEFIEPLTLPKPGAWQYPTTLKIPTAARDLILSERVKAMRGQQDSLNGHALFVREKFAFALALLDGRSEMSPEDWELSGIAANVSDATRDWVARTMESAKQEQAIEFGRELGQRRAAADDEQQYQQAMKRSRVEGKILGYLDASDKTRREIGKLFDSRSRSNALWVLDQLVKDERVVRSEPRQGDRSDTERYGLNATKADGR
jgi:hypothetical protein